MQNTQFQQFSNRRRPVWQRASCIGCALFAIAVPVVIIAALLLFLPGIAMQIAGFEPVGHTDAILASAEPPEEGYSMGALVILDTDNDGVNEAFNANSSVSAVVGSGNTNDTGNTGGADSAGNGTGSAGILMSPNTSSTAPTVRFSQATRPASVFVNANEYGTYTVTQDEAIMYMGADASGRQMLTVQFTEAQALAMCARRTPECGAGTDYVRNVMVDFRRSGVIIYADVKVPSTGIWQRGGGVGRFNNVTRQIDILGVDMDGTLYRAPQEVFGMSFEEMVAEGNRAISQISVNANGTTFHLSEVHVGDDAVTMIWR